MKRYLLILPGLSLLTSCGFFKEDIYKPESPKVGKILSSFEAPISEVRPLEAATVADLIVRFEKVKFASEDPQQHYLVAKRLAQLRLMAVDQQIVDGVEGINYDLPIAALEELKSLEADHQSQSEVSYQLAKMQELKGAPDHVLTALIQLIDLGGDDPATREARFRRAEIYFSRDDYIAAESDYAKVSEQSGQYQLHARYMLTWVRFKRGDLDGALDMAADALAQLAQLAEIDGRYEELKRDLLRVVVITLDYADGPVALAELMAERGKPDWQTDVYRALGDWYLAKTRFADSAATWSTFLVENPMHRDAPKIALQVIGTQREAGFVDTIPTLELSFIERYGKQSEFYDLHGEEVFSVYRAELKPMLERHIQRLHAAAQQSNKSEDYLSAARAYRIWLLNFAGDPDGQEKRFLLAEALSDGGELEQALVEYEGVIAADSTSEFAKESAYAVVLGSEGSSPEVQIDANLRFVILFGEDSRAATSQLKAASLLFQQQNFERALKVAELAAAMVQNVEDVETARRIMGHSAFELGDFALAARIYRTLQQARSTSEIHERLLATVFKQGERAERSGDLTLAIEFYRDLERIDPKAALSRDAQYDIAALYERAGDDAAAIDQLKRYRQTYPDDHAKEISLRLIGLYETSGRLEAAAAELLADHFDDRGIASIDRAKRRYRAAELYLEAGNLPLAIEHFRFYAHNHPDPVALQLEAMHHMDLLYQHNDEPAKRRFWLRKIRDRVKVMDQTTERMRFLAAGSSFVLAEDQFKAFKSISLRQPLKRSLQKKQRALQLSLTAYEDVTSFAVLEFVTQANLANARLYQVLAEDLLASERPKGLNTLEQDQYQLLLEEQAYPFEEQAIELHQANLSLGWKVGWDDAVNQSLIALQTLAPGRFARQEREVAYVDSAQ